MRISGNIVDVLHETIYPGILTIIDGKIEDINHEPKANDRFFLPGFIDAHIHIESTMLVPSEFARLAAVHGTVAAICDPHEIANVLGLKGVRYMIENSRETPFYFFFGAPSCVPASSFESAGAKLDTEMVDKLLSRKDIKYLSEVMNFPGVLNADPLIMDKIAAAKRHGKLIDGHAPGLRGDALDIYIQAGITTDHETVTEKEGKEKLEKGMKLLIREGSAAKNFAELIPLLERYPEQCMFCTDDIYPDELLRGHINLLAKRAFKKGIDKWKVLKATTVNPVQHYGLETGLLRKGDPANFIIIDNFENFNILGTYIKGVKAAEKGQPCLKKLRPTQINNFNTSKKNISDFAVRKRGNKVNVIEAIDGQIITEFLQVPLKSEGDWVLSDPEQDILKLTVVNRYCDKPPSVGFIKNFGLKKGAIATSVSHDSHNVVAVGVDDRSICRAVNCVITNKGGLVAVSEKETEILPLPIAGLMSDHDYNFIAANFTKLDRFAKKLGSTLQSPFMTLSFMSLLVVPEIKLSDRGLFDSKQLRFIELFAPPVHFT